jgi:hypothetical protein
MIADVLGDERASGAFCERYGPCFCLTIVLGSLRHQVLQLAVVFTCSIGQLSPGAYLLRRDLFPAIVKVQITIS